MPLSNYFHGHGPEVMREMQAKHGEDEGKSIFYATANKRGQGPKKKKGSKAGKQAATLRRMK